MTAESKEKSAFIASRQAFYDYLDRKNEPWKYQTLADSIRRFICPLKPQSARLWRR